MAQRHLVGTLNDIPADRGREVVVAGRVIALFRQDDGISAVDGICPHAGGPLAQGMVRNCVVTCPWHGWQFNTRTGQHQLTARFKVETFPAGIDAEGNVWVEVP